MGKHGPCYHCGVTSTPLWRNGPPEKPVLCNACGSRWRTKGTLVNYTPLHARAEPEDFDDYRASKAKSLPIKNNEEKFLKRKYNSNSNITEFPEYNNQGFRKVFDEDTSNRSSSGSAISNSESCAQYGSADASDLTGPSAQGVVWDATVPSRKRTCVTRSKPSSFEKVTRDLYTIWHEEQSSCLSVSSEEDVLLEYDRPMVSVEIGHGSMLIRHPSSIIAREEESEASSLSFDNNNNKQQHIARGLVIEKIKKPPPNPGTEQERIRRGKDEKLQIMTHRNSPLCCIDLQEILNFDKFANHLTNDEQHWLMKFLPSIDTSEAPDRKLFPLSHVRSMMESPEFKDNLLSFQKLLSDGLFDNSLSGLNAEDCVLLKKIVLQHNLTKSECVEQYKFFKDPKGKNINKSSEIAGESKRSREGLHQKFSGSKIIPVNKDSSFITSCNNDDDEYSHYGYEQEDLLLDIPSNGLYPEAELLIPSSSFDAQVSTSSSSVYPYLGRRS